MNASKKGTSANTDRTMLSEPAIKAVMPAPAPKSRVGLWLTIAVLAMGGTGFGVWKFMDGQQASTVQTPPGTQGADGAQGTPTGGATTPPTTDPSGTGSQAPSNQVASAPQTPVVTNPTTSTVPPVTREPAPAPASSPATRPPRRPPASTSTPSTPTQTANQPPATQPQPAPVTQPSAPAPSTPAASSMAVLQLILNVPGAVLIDGVAKGERSRMVDSLRAGQHSIRVEKAGFVPLDTIISFNAGETKRVTLTLVARP